MASRPKILTIDADRAVSRQLAADLGQNHELRCDSSRVIERVRDSSGVAVIPIVRSPFGVAR